MTTQSEQKLRKPSRQPSRVAGRVSEKSDSDHLPDAGDMVSENPDTKPIEPPVAKPAEAYSVTHGDFVPRFLSPDEAERFWQSPYASRVKHDPAEWLVLWASEKEFLLQKRFDT